MSQHGNKQAERSRLISPITSHFVHNLLLCFFFPLDLGSYSEGLIRLGFVLILHCLCARSLNVYFSNIDTIMDLMSVPSWNFVGVVERIRTWVFFGCLSLLLKRLLLL